jgi:selenocysteine-specific translation elongation factor
MPNLNVAVIGSPGYAKGLGKKSTESDITFYDQKKGDTTVTFVEPTKYPEKLAPLFYCASMADLALLIVEQITPSFGESVVMLDSVGVARGMIVLRNYISKEQIAPFLKDTVLEAYEFVEDDALRIRERLLSEAGRIPEPDHGTEKKSGSVPVDHYFDVRGVGTVVLGWVSEGLIGKHDDARLMPSGKPVQVRSIQKHDDDFDWAAKGDRVGLALKGVGVKDLDRGMVITTNDSVRPTASIEGVAKIVRFWLNPLAPGMVIHVCHWMQFVPARVESVVRGADWRRPRLSLSLQGELAYLPGSKAVLAYLEGGKLRIVGTMELA